MTSQPMLTRVVPSSGEAIPVIGLGTWESFDPPSVTPSVLDRLGDVIRTLMSSGGTVIDSSPMYGRSEELTGMLLERLDANQSVFLATKIWTSGGAQGREQLAASRRLLRRERLDLEQVHNLVDWRTHLPMLRREKEAGRVRYIGVTHYLESSFGELEGIIRRERLDFVQLPYSIGLRAAERRLLPAAADTGTAVIVNRPFEGGDLFSRVRTKPLPDWVTPFAGSWAQAFLKFILANPAVTCAIPGTANPDHMRDNTAAGSRRMPTPEEVDRLVRSAVS